jgi:DNA-binding transcriptional ArsR family regulator
MSVDPAHGASSASGPSDALTTFDLVGRALADGTRRRILLTLAGAPAYPADLALELAVSRPAMSNHLACLRDCGLVVGEPEGRRVRYRLVDRRLAHALTDLAGLSLHTIDGHA